MPSDHPQTPESPSQTSFAADTRTKSTSPRFMHSLPTPAHSINGSMTSLGPDNAMDGFHDESSNKRKRAVDDNGDREQKKVHVEDRSLSIEDLHLDVGEKYLLCNTPHKLDPPVPYTKDLFDLYGLNGIAQSVARHKPDGSKNSLRKTYKNYFKTFDLAGSWDVKAKPAGDVDPKTSLEGLMMIPEEEWQAQSVRQKEIGRGLSDTAMANMNAAFKMSKGRIPKESWNPSVLGEIGPRAVAAEPAKAMHNGVKAQALPNAAVARTAKGEIPRPKRNVKKRSYGDSSYEGYGEGFVDDDTQETGYSTGEGDDRSGRKRPKKGPAHNFQGPMRQNSYGPGMVGV
ncbi:Rox3 mediator complex subunit-domain-containing protein [Halenospora varia]|nr:Rox3 mediator complex subunit-domain-containing protein [Halenospora varia]